MDAAPRMLESSQAPQDQQAAEPATALTVVLAQEGGRAVSGTEGSAGKRPEGLGKRALEVPCAQKEILQSHEGLRVTWRGSG